jgi:hypothetical protein
MVKMATQGQHTRGRCISRCRCVCGAVAITWIGLEPTCATTVEAARQLLASDVRAGRRPWLERPSEAQR